jgi:hypothetical protein
MLITNVISLPDSGIKLFRPFMFTFTLRRSQQKEQIRPN